MVPRIARFFSWDEDEDKDEGEGEGEDENEDEGEDKNEGGDDEMFRWIIFDVLKDAYHLESVSARRLGG